MTTEDRELLNAIERGDDASIDTLVRARANANVNTERGGLSPLVLATLLQRRAAIKSLVGLGARLHCRCTLPESILREIVDGNAPAITAALLVKKAAVTSVDGDGETPLHLACYFSFTEVARVLLKAGAWTELRNSRGERPIDVVRDDVATDLTLLHSCIRSHCTRRTDRQIQATYYSVGGSYTGAFAACRGAMDATPPCSHHAAAGQVTN